MAQNIYVNGNEQCKRPFLVSNDSKKNNFFLTFYSKMYYIH